MLHFFLQEGRIDTPWWTYKGSLGGEMLIALLFLISLGWVMFDARRRNKSAFLAAVFLVLSIWPLSLLWWCWLRPVAAPSPADAGSR